MRRTSNDGAVPEREITSRAHRMHDANGPRRSIAVVVAVLAVLAAACQYDPAQVAPGNEALSHCEGEPATIGVGYHPDVDPENGSVYYGTEGRDVVVITNGPVTFYAGGGDDLICINDTGLAWGADGYGGGARVPFGTIAIETGLGADTVHNNLPHSPDTDTPWGVFDLTVSFGQHAFWSIVGDGHDQFFGGPAAERVQLHNSFNGEIHGGSRVTAGGGDDHVEVHFGAPELVDCGTGADRLDVYDSSWDPTTAIDC